MNKHNFFYFIKEGAFNMFSHGFMSFAAVGITVACLLIMGTFTLVAVNANAMLEDMESQNQMLAFVDKSLSEDEARAMEQVILSLDNVAKATFISNEEAAAAFRGRYEDDEPVRRRGSVWPIFLAVAAVLLFVGLVAYFLWNTLFAGVFAPPETHSVPNLVGRMYEDVKDNTELLAGFTLIEGDTIADDADPGTIIDQDPKGDNEVGETITEIKVTISGGPEIIPVPRLDGMNFQDASTTLRNVGLKAAVPDYEFDETIEQGYVISYTPTEGVELSPGTEVHMVISKGPEDKPFPMPKLLGMTKARALAEIENKNLKQGNVEQEEYDDEIEEGKVISQYPLEGADVTEGTEVNLVISKGPDPATQPPDPPVPSSGTKYVTVDQLDRFEGTITVQLFMDGGEIGRETVDTNMDTAVTFQVSGTGSKTLTYYINGVATGTIPVNVDE